MFAHMYSVYFDQKQIYQNKMIHYLETDVPFILFRISRLCVYALEWYLLHQY